MRDAMEGRNFPHHLQQQQHHHRPIFQHQQQLMMMMGSAPSTTTMSASPSSGAGAATGVVVDVVVEGDRTFPQWSVQETKEFISIRSELDRTFMETKRNKVLWEVISSKMRDRGYQRSAEQCKCKWKNLVTRYKGCESIEAEEMRQQQFPFYNELQAIFTSRTMQHMLWAEKAEGGAASTGAGGHKRKTLLLSSDEDELDELDIVHRDKVIEDQLADVKNVTTTRNINSSSSIKKRKKAVQKGGVGVGVGVDAGGATISLMIKEVLEEFMKRQEAIEAEWRARYEAKENERRIREEEWRRRIEALEVERASMERHWREKDDARRAREEARADKRDALISALLNKLTSSSSSQ